MEEEEFLVNSSNMSIEPNIDSIRFKGKIYLLQNGRVFSAAGSLSTLALSSDKIVSAGGNIFEGGSGMNPYIFTLPHSRLSFRVAATVDLTKVNNIEDLLHNQVEIPVIYSFDEFIESIYFDGDVYSEAFLLEKDPVFKTIIITGSDKLIAFRRHNGRFHA